MNFITPNWPAPKHIKAYTTLRTGWGGRKPHHDLNKGNYKNDDPHYVAESENLKKLLHLPDEPIWITQTHSNIAIEALPENKERLADASYTNKANHVCVVLTADCLPILICNQQGTHVAVIHAGWRGLANGIIETTLAALGRDVTGFMVWLGPAIGPSKFEVGKDVYDAFTTQHADTELAFQPHIEGKWHADLYTLAKIRLKKLGISQIYGGEYCTYTQQDLFFSYRRDKGRTGRMASLIWIESN